MQPIPPIVLRAQSVKAELADSQNMKVKVEKKDEDIKELRRLLKLKVSWHEKLLFFNNWYSVEPEGMLVKKGAFVLALSGCVSRKRCVTDLLSV